MAGYEASIGHRLNAMMRFYVSRSPAAAEAIWQSRQQFERLPAEKKEFGHWYRYPGPGGLIEVRADGSGQWHADDSLPEGTDPNLVVDVPAGEPAPSLMDRMAAVVAEYPKDAPGAAQVVAIPQQFEALGSPDRAMQMVKGFQQTLASIPLDAEKLLQFLHQTSRRLVEEELVAGKVSGDEVASVLLITAIGDAIGPANPRCAAILKTIAGWKVVALDELAMAFTEACWQFGMGDKATAALDAVRSAGENRLQIALEGAYLNEPGERVLDIYYAMLLQTIPYFLGASNGYYKLSHAKLSADDLRIFKKKTNTAEEKLVRLMTALLYAVTDVDLSRFEEQRAKVGAALAAGDHDKADSIIRNVIDLEFFYPPAFKAILRGEKAVLSAGGTSASG
jgi:hypothetical protein